MKFLISLLLTVCTILPSSRCLAEIVVIVHPENEITEISHQQVIDYYMGRLKFFPDGQRVLPLDQNVDSDGRQQFYLKLTGKTIPQINAYWARLLFAGRATPPIQLEDQKEVIHTVSSNKSAIGYVSAEAVPDSVKIVASVD